ncbi:Poly polymerase [Aspergillus undulatus]|uniref:Poly polymerase n=1 Tax=Aspergillus undulatus TaxID=1810928 RepID=UPI003CCE4F59
MTKSYILLCPVGNAMIVKLQLSLFHFLTLLTIERANPGCTHLVITPKEVQRNSSRVTSEHNAYTTEIVSLDWLLKSEYRVTLPGEGSQNVQALTGQVAGVKRMRTGVFPDTQKPIIPAHKPCPFKYEFSIFIDVHGHPWDAMMVQSTSQGKTNNYFHPQMLVDSSGTRFVTWACWGRIGDASKQLTTAPCVQRAPRASFKLLFYKKLGIWWRTRFWDGPREGKFRFMAPGYVFSNPFDITNPYDITLSGADMGKRIYNVPAPEYSLPQAVQNVVALILEKKLLSNATVYDAQKLPLGQVSRETILEGHKVLANLADLIRPQDLAWMGHRRPLAEATALLSSQYFSLIPHVLGKKETSVISSQGRIDEETQLLDELADAVVANDIINSANNNYVHPLEKRLRGLGLDETTPITDIFRIRPAGEEERFRSSVSARLPVSNRILLWHGSNTTNFARILIQGLRIRPDEVANAWVIPARGYLSTFPGLSMAFSSAGLTAPGLLLLCDVGPGNPVNVASAAGDVLGQKPGTISTNAGPVQTSLAGTRMPDVSGYMPGLRRCVYVAYDPAQVRIRYLVFVGRRKQQC